MSKKRWLKAKLQRRKQRQAGTFPRPEIGHDEVLVAHGEKFHTTWCDAMNGVWLSWSNHIHAIHVDEAFDRGLELCQLCAVKYNLVETRF